VSAPRALVVEASLRRRLEVMDALSAVFEVEALPEGEGPARAARRGRYALAVISAEPDPDEALRAARALRADFSAPPAVLVLDPVGRLPDPGGLLRPEQAQGVWVGAPEAAGLRALALDCLRGAGRVVHAQRAPGLLRRLLGRR
jgi:hypothetical protein